MVQKLIARGMNIEDADEAERVLTHINYYRLSPYWRIFEIDREGGNDTFMQGTDFDRVLRHYNFDRKLRALLMAEIDIVEISLRRSWSSHLAINYGPFANQNAKLFSGKAEWRKGLTILMNEYGKSQELFAKHYLQKYEDLTLPPIWICAELMTFGMLSKLIGNLANPKDRQEISKPYNLDEVILISFLHHLVNVRNIVAHHSRIWNRKLVIVFKLPQNKTLGLWEFFNHDPKSTKKIYNTLVLLTYLSEKINPTSEFRRKLTELIEEFSEIDPRAMGFPDDWEKMIFWATDGN